MPHDLIAAVAHRTTRLHGITAAAAGALAAAVIVIALSVSGGTPFVRLLAAAAGGAGTAVAVMYASRTRRGPRAAAAAIERARPAANLVVTAEELRRTQGGTGEWLAARIEHEAARRVAGLRAADVVSSRAAVLLVLVAAGATTAALLIGGDERARQALTRIVRSDTLATDGRARPTVLVVVSPPAYTGRDEVTLSNPERIDALEESRLRFELRGGTGWRIRFGEEEVGTAFVAREGGYFAIADPAGAAPAILIPLIVTRDRAPVVRIETPAKDLLLPDPRRRIDVSVTASDDIALARLEVRYTKVTGAGEQFEFEEGSIAVDAERLSGREWRGTARLPLDALRLGAGDSLVYRAVARDRRAGDAALGSSDTYFVEIAGPGQVPLEGVEMPSDMERYAMSQQMIVLKIERLRARERSLPREALVEETAAIAAEQRTVRANFVFLLGGHVEDEEEEAEQSHEIQEGRLENTARRDISSAIGHMTRAEQGLVAADTSVALPAARRAVEALQRAFGRSRYLLRALASRSRLDPSRRLTGELRDAGDWRRPRHAPDAREGSEVRAVFERLLEAAAADANAAAPVGLDALAESALAIDPASPRWQEVSRRLLVAAGAAGAERTNALREAVALVGSDAQRGTIQRTPLARRQTAVRRAWEAEQRR